LRAIHDTQIVELLGRNWLINELVRAGLEVAVPSRDHGVDLIAYVDLKSSTERFIAKPIQLKAASTCSFGIDRKYARISDLIIAFVWNLQSNATSTAFAMNYSDAEQIATEMGYTRTSSWIDNGKYSNSNPGTKLRSLLAPYQMSSDLWRKKITE